MSRNTLKFGSSQGAAIVQNNSLLSHESESKEIPSSSMIDTREKSQSMHYHKSPRFNNKLQQKNVDPRALNFSPSH